MEKILEQPKKVSSTAFLTVEQQDNYLRDGFLILNNFINHETCELLIERANLLIQHFNPENMKIIFSTKDQRQSKSLYFLDSGDKIRFFFEENAIDAEGELKADKKHCINKIGHALHDLDPLFSCFSRQHKFAALAQDLDIIDPLLIQSMYLCKQPHIGDEVACHQDSSYLFVKEHPVVGFWIALEDATIENGCLWAIPGAHRGPLKSRYIRGKNDRMTTEIYDSTDWPMEKMVPLEVPRGSLIVLNGLLPHMSKENISPRSRHAYSLHLMSGLNEFADNNWLQRPKEMPFKGFML